MTATANETYNWLKQIPTGVLQLDEVPLLGNPPPFSWEIFSKELSDTFNLSDLKIEPKEFRWLDADQILSGMDDKVIPLNFTVSPLDGIALWIFSEQDVALLISLLLTQKAEIITPIDPNFERSFEQFLAIEAINALRKANFDSNLSPQLLEQQELPKKPVLACDISIQVLGQKIWGRLLLTKEFQESWKEHYTQEAFKTRYNPALSDAMQLTVHLEGGKTTMSRSDWKQIKEGDFVILDQCSLEAGGQKGRVIMTINQTPYFRAKLKDGNLKILEFPLIYEVETPMAKKFNEEDEEFEQEESDFGLSEDEDFEFTEDEEYHDSETGDEEMTSEEDLDQEYEESLFGKEEEGEEIHKPLEEEEKRSASKATAAPAKKEQLAKPEEIPLTITVEIARLKMTLQQLSELQPGNLLELNSQPGNGVDLVTNGKAIARGELLKIGDSLGVRILEIG